MSDSEAVALPFELTGQGESDQAVTQLDAVVYARLAQAYGDGEPPTPRRSD